MTSPLESATFTQVVTSKDKSSIKLWYALVYDFYETPQRDTHTKNNDTPDGLDFTADAQNVPQTVNDEAAEDIEININNTDNINNGLLEKQVSPTPQFKF